MSPGQALREGQRVSTIEPQSACPAGEGLTHESQGALSGLIFTLPPAPTGYATAVTFLWTKEFRWNFLDYEWLQGWTGITPFILFL